MLVTLGDNVAFGMLDGTAVRVPAVAAQVVDSTGAGDAFCGGVIAGLIHGITPEAALRRGTHAAARILNQTGGLVTDPKIMAGLTKESV